MSDLNDLSADLPVLTYLESRLRGQGTGGVSRRRFSEISARLLASGLLWREYSRPEQALYDDATVVEELLREWFDALGFVLVHDADGGIFRLYPPGDDDDEEDGVKRLRARLSRDFIAAALALRFLYTEALTGKRELVNQELVISTEELSESIVSLLGLTLPASVADRAALLRDLRKHRLVRLSDTDGLGRMETLLSVLRPVMSFVSDEALNDVMRLTPTPRTSGADASTADTTAADPLSYQGD